MLFCKHNHMNLSIEKYYILIIYKFDVKIRININNEYKLS